MLAPLLEPDQRARRSMAVRQSPGVKTRRYTYHAIIDGKKSHIPKPLYRLLRKPPLHANAVGNVPDPGGQLQALVIRGANNHSPSSSLTRSFNLHNLSPLQAVVLGHGVGDHDTW